jgi:acetyl-CoA carboxylase biotin carboxyl carrier protein
VDIGKLRELIELLKEADLTEIELREGDASIRLSRQGVLAMPPADPARGSAPGATTTTPLAAPHEEGRPGETLRGHVIHSPMVGTFYRSPSPTAKAFIEVGSTVKPGDVLCIIEAMKMMNQIESDKAGRVASVLVKNGDPVEFGQPLFVIE